MSAPLDIGADDALFDIEAPPPVSLADKFGVPPMSVLDRRSGDWQDRKRKWLSLGVASELGRDAAAVNATAEHRQDFMARLLRGDSDGPRTIGALNAGGVSVFDPVLCELVYRWFSRPGDCVLDPFAGGSVRGVVASTLARWYTGLDIREEQIEANRAQAHLGSDIEPTWHLQDSTAAEYQAEYDLIFSCPPYHDLERYSDDPRDLSNMTYDEFVSGHAAAIARACDALRPERFAAWVISDVRDRRGAYRGLVGAAVDAFVAAGLTFHNEAIVLDPVGAAALRAERPFVATRKLTRVHQHLLIFVKGDAKRAATRITEAPA
jgi:hypothetical protein